jgi:hypothetical protein
MSENTSTDHGHNGDFFFRVHGCVFWHYGDFWGIFQGLEVFSDIMVIFCYFSGSVDVFSDIMVIFLLFFRVCGSVFWHGDFFCYFSGSVEVFSDIMVIFLLFFRVCGSVFCHYGDFFVIFLNTPKITIMSENTSMDPEKKNHHYVRKHIHRPWKITKKSP